MLPFWYKCVDTGSEDVVEPQRNSPPCHYIHFTSPHVQHWQCRSKGNIFPYRCCKLPLVLLVGCQGFKGLSDGAGVEPLHQDALGANWFTAIKDCHRRILRWG